MLTDIAIAIIAAFAGVVLTYIFTRRGAHRSPCRYTEAVNQRVDGLEGSLKIVDKKVDDLKVEVDNNKTSISVLNTSSAVLTEQYKSIMSTLDKMDTKLDKIHSLKQKEE